MTATTTINDLWCDKPKQPDMTPSQVLQAPTDRASLMFETYRLLGLLDDSIDRDTAIGAIGIALYDLASASEGLNLETYLMPPSGNGMGFQALFSSYHNLINKRFKLNSIWEKYGDSPLDSAPQMSIARGMIVGNETNSYQERGLYLEGKGLLGQLNNGMSFINKTEAKRPEITVTFLDPVSYLCINAIRYVGIRYGSKERQLDQPAGKYRLREESKPTHTSFVGMKSSDIAVKSSSLVPGASYNHGKGWPEFRAAPLIGHPARGVRFTVGRKIEQTLD